MTENFYAQKVNTKSRKAMIDFLTNHFRYFTINSWNNSKSYANNVKIPNLGINDKDLLDKAYDVIMDDIDNDELYDEIQYLIDDFTIDYHFTAGFNGKNGGYLVLYQVEFDDDGTARIYPGRSVGSNDPDYFRDWNIGKLRRLTKTVCAFDKLCDEIRNFFISYVRDSEVIEIEEIITKKQRTLKEG